MDYVIKGREPADALRYFEELSAIPRASGNEKASAEYVMAFAKEHGLWCHMDEVYNVIVKKPGSKGCEDLPPVLLQGHLDMVCEKNNDVEHNFDTDPIQLVVDGDTLRAKGTTLGADNGTAVSYMMAILARKDLVHPPIECLFTSMEEIGLLGAPHVDETLLDAHRLINMDCGPQGEAIVGSAGGMQVYIEKKAPRTPVTGKLLTVEVKGLHGGHSGGDIDKERGNANKIMARLLRAAAQATALRLVSFNGGLKFNAIPRECVAVVEVADEVAATAAIRRVEAQVKGELEFSDAGFYLELSEGSTTLGALSSKDSLDFLTMLFTMPCGVVAKSMALENLVVTSVNMGVVNTTEAGFKMTYSIRSSLDSLLDMVAEQLVALAQAYGATAENSEPFASWEYVANSPMREVCCRIYKEMTGEEMHIKATHGGLECGVFRSKIPDLDIIAMGPNASGAHTPQEELDLISYEWFFGYILRILEELTK